MNALCIRQVVGSFLTLTTAFGFFACSGKPPSTKAFATSMNVKLKPIDIPFTMSVKSAPKLALTFEEWGGGPDLKLASTVASGMTVAVSGCASGYVKAETAITTGTISLYKGDQNCKVQLLSFKIGSLTYAGTFSSWVEGASALYLNTAAPHDGIKVYLNKQVSASGVQSTDSVAYTFVDINGGNSPNVTVSESISISVTGAPSPDIDVTAARFLGVNSNGSANFAFTFNCLSAAVVGTGAAATCSGVNMKTQFSYMMVPDTFSGAPTVQQAMALFAGSSPSPIPLDLSKIIAAGGSDDSANVVAHGGFYTGNSSPLVTGTTPIYPNNLNYILFVQESDLTGQQLSYVYFPIIIASVVQN